MVKNYKDIVIQKLKKFTRDDIDFTPHAMLRARVRGLDPEEIKKNIINPKRLYHAEKQKAKKKGEEKYNCYFGFSKTQVHRYVIVINKKIEIVTVIKINRRWQRKVEKRGKL
jgi:hypothetical protein